jgi:hypothetical protein
MAAERAIGMFYIQMSDEDIKAFHNRLEAYLNDR